MSGLRAGYGHTRVLHGLDFELEPGSITALLGANGAGKTTTLRALCGMVNTQGELRFSGQSIARRATEDIARLGIAHVPDGRGTFLHLTTEENLRLGAYAHPKDSIELRFKLGSDGCTGSFGWYVDDLLVYRCHSPGSGRGPARGNARVAR